MYIVLASRDRTSEGYKGQRHGHSRFLYRHDAQKGAANRRARRVASRVGSVYRVEPFCLAGGNQTNRAALRGGNGRCFGRSLVGVACNSRRGAPAAGRHYDRRRGKRPAQHGHIFGEPHDTRRRIPVQCQVPHRCRRQERCGGDVAPAGIVPAADNGIALIRRFKVHKRRVGQDIFAYAVVSGHIARLRLSGEPQRAVSRDDNRNAGGKPACRRGILQPVGCRHTHIFLGWNHRLARHHDRHGDNNGRPLQLLSQPEGVYLDTRRSAHDR